MSLARTRTLTREQIGVSVCQYLPETVSLRAFCAATENTEEFMQTNIVPSRNPSALPRIRSALMLVLAVVLVGFAAAGPPRAQAATTVTVSPITPNGWGFGQKVATGTVSFLARPATANLVPLMVVYVDDSWAGTPAGSDPDGAGPANVFGGAAFATIQAGIDAVASGGTV